jgi:hypothetical protein
MSSHTVARLGASLPLLVLVAAPAFGQQHGGQQQGAAATMSEEQMIASAMSAAPEAVSKDATIVAVAPDGTMRTLREGKNGFTCLPDNPASPGPDPMCGDANAMAWAEAWIAHKEPPAGKVGLMYMLASGSDASNTDPYATEPAPGNNWIETGPHVMILGAKGLMEGYPRDPQPDTKAPYVMWADTPYEHLMIPVR